MEIKHNFRDKSSVPAIIKVKKKMEINTFYNKIITDETMMETIQHGNKEYPFRFYYDDLSLFDFNCEEWHWHTEFEFLVIESGSVTFQIGEKQFCLERGYGIFINSKVLHRFFSKERAVIPNFVFAPTFLAPQESLIYKKYVLPIQTSVLDGFVFSPEVPWQAEAISIMKEIITVQDSEKDVELVSSFLVQKLWHLMYINLEEKYLKQRGETLVSTQVRLQMMMQYIHENYREKILLEDISNHGTVSKSTALNLFRRYLDDTPVHYLLRYRLQESAKLLVTTEKKIAVISEYSGFDNVEYFCKMFKKYYKMTPTEYRRKKQ